jgi:DNA-binding NtrC family response regulator
MKTNPMDQHKGKIIVIDDEEKIRTILAMVLRDDGYDVATVKDGIEGIEHSKLFRPQVAIVDLQMPKMDGIETCAKLKEVLPEIVTIILTAHGSIPSAVQAIKQGVYDYITKPYDNDRMLTIVKNAMNVVRLREEIQGLRLRLGEQNGVDRILGESDVMRNIRAQILQFAQSETTVLIEGESGTGKELAARAIHYESSRRDRPLVIVDCTTIPATLVESEFFGYEKGAFTDARERRIGKFEEANTGTVFLDEIGELPLAAQSKLLRVLQEKEFTRIGDTSPVRIDVRVIAATNKHLEEQVREGKFREDLFYRLNVLRVQLPPLREHREDIPHYVRFFLAHYRERFGKYVEAFSDEALESMMNREWKGNIRELENVVQRAIVHTSSQRIEPPDLEASRPQATQPVYDPDGGLEVYIHQLMEYAERQIINQILRDTNGNRTIAAEKLKISRKTLFNKMQQYGIQ